MALSFIILTSVSSIYTDTNESRTRFNLREPCGLCVGTKPFSGEQGVLGGWYQASTHNPV